MIVFILGGCGDWVYVSIIVLVGGEYYIFTSYCYYCLFLLNGYNLFYIWEVWGDIGIIIRIICFFFNVLRFVNLDIILISVIKVELFYFWWF